jgi:hypothetical protein
VRGGVDAGGGSTLYAVHEVTNCTRGN